MGPTGSRMDVSLAALGRFARSVVAQKLLDRPATVFVSYMVTTRCTRACTYCDLASAGGELDLATFERILDELVAAGLARMGFTGGEPLLHPDLAGMLAACRRRGVMTVVSTNGDLVARHPERVADAGWVSLSLDGDRATHDRFRGEGSYDAVLAAVEELRRRGQRFATSTVLTRDNLHAVDHVLTLARRHGFATVWQPYFANNAGAAADERLRPSPDALREVTARLRAVRREDPERLLQPEAVLDFIDAHYPEYAADGCHAGRLFWALAPDGRMFPCYPLLGVGDGYDLVRGSVADLLRGAPQPLCARGCFCSGHVENQFVFNFHPLVWLAQARALL